MKAHLLHRDRDIDLARPLPWNQDALTRDLALDTLFNAMARDDAFVLDVVKKVIFSGFDNDPATIRYRQAIMQDCLNQPAIVRELYAIATAAMEEERKHYLGMLVRYPDFLLRHSVELMVALLGMIKKLRKITDLHAEEFSSEGWREFFATLRRELSDEYFARIQRDLAQLKFRDGVLLSAELGKGNKGSRYILHTLPQPRHRGWQWLKSRVAGWLTRLFGWGPRILGFSLHPRDEAGVKALEELRDRGLGLVANALGQSTDHVRSFFDMLRAELAFYVGCMNLDECLARKGEPRCFASPATVEDRQLSFRGLYDVCLALNVDGRVVGNDANADDKNLVMVTGANQGGKSTFLRSIGLAQLMMQCGMLAPADSFRSSLCNGLFTHYKREEDAGMTSGKFDEELRRMSDIVDHLTPHPMILFNESFAATNEREGSEIARQIISALLDHGTRIVCVTHLYELAHSVHDRNIGNALFLRAERQAEGARTFKLVEGEPLQTSYGEDLYTGIFGAEPDRAKSEKSPIRVDAT